MALSEKEIEELKEVLNRTGGNREKSQKERIIPDEYTAHQNNVVREEWTIDSPSTGVPCRVIKTTAKNKDENCPMLVNYHGGGFIHPQDHDDDMFCARVADDLHGVVVDIDYAVTPDYFFETIFEQSWDMALWAFSKAGEWGVDPKRIAIGGHSAGGCLTAAISLRTAATKDIQPCLQILDYAANDNYMPFEPGGLERSRAFSTLYVNGNIRELQSPFCSPAYATDEMLENNPKTLIINAKNCPFCAVNTKYGERLAAAGVEVTMKTFVNSRHGFTIRLVDEWDEAQKLIVRSILEA